MKIFRHRGELTRPDLTGMSSFGFDQMLDVDYMFKNQGKWEDSYSKLLDKGVPSSSIHTYEDLEGYHIQVRLAGMENLNIVENLLNDFDDKKVIEI